MSDKLNHPEGVMLLLTQTEAKRMMSDCDANLAIELNLLSAPETSEATLIKVVSLIEHFRGIRDKLVAEGVTTDE